MELIIERLKELHRKSTRVNYWYDHGSEDGTIRGPFHRWIKVEEVDKAYKDNVASVAEDAAYCTAALNYVPLLLKEIEMLQRKVNDLEVNKILLED